MLIVTFKGCQYHVDKPIEEFNNSKKQIFRPKVIALFDTPLLLFNFFRDKIYPFKI